jgi:hypothetical protein
MDTCLIFVSDYFTLAARNAREHRIMRLLATVISIPGLKSSPASI